MKKVTIIIAVLCLFLADATMAQKRKKNDWQGINNVTLEQGFPAAYEVLKTYGLGLDVFAYGQKRMKSTFYIYSRGILEGQARARILVSIDDGNRMDIQFVDFQEENNGYWVEGGAALFSKKERKTRNEMGKKIEAIVNDPASLNTSAEAFFKDLSVNRAFFATATELAGDRWFEKYLKNRQISWMVVFDDIQKNKDSDDYQYKEEFSYNTEATIGSASSFTPFKVVKYTNMDANVLVSTGSRLKVTGYCRQLIYDNFMGFYLIVTDKPDSPIPANSLQAGKN